MHKLKQEFTVMTEEALLFWLQKFVEKLGRAMGVSIHRTVCQSCCGLSRALKSDNRVDIDMFNSPKFTQFRDTLDACMKTLKATGQFTVQQAETITEEIEDLLQNKGLLGDSTPQCLLDMAEFYLTLLCLMKWSRAQTSVPLSFTVGVV